jgi:hypothetical protein
MDSLHGVLRSIRTETKADRKHLAVFREFLAHLDQAQRQAQAMRAKPPVRRKPKRRGRAG